MIKTLSVGVKTIDNKKRRATELPTSNKEDEVNNIVEETKLIKIMFLNKKSKKQSSLEIKMNVGLH